MKRYYNNGKSAWRPDTFPTGSSRRNYSDGRRDHGGFARGNQDDGIVIGSSLEEPTPDDSVGGKLDRVLDRLEKFDSWREETDRRFESIDSTTAHYQDVRVGFDEAEDSDGEDVQRRRNWEKGSRARNPSFVQRDRRADDWGRRERRERTSSCWDPPETRNSRPQFGGYEQPQERQASCWDPLNVTIHKHRGTINHIA